MAKKQCSYLAASEISLTHECPVCHKQFELSAETMYQVGRQFNYTCSWKCFLQYVNEHPSTKPVRQKLKKF